MGFRIPRGQPENLYTRAALDGLSALQNTYVNVCIFMKVCIVCICNKNKEEDKKLRRSGQHGRSWKGTWSHEHDVNIIMYDVLKNFFKSLNYAISL